MKFLIYKYPPSRKKIVDTELSDRIVATKEYLVVENDMLKNAQMDLGLRDGQTNFDKDIKIWINKLIAETNK